MALNGFNTVMTDPYRQSLDPLAARGMKGIVWLGAWFNAPRCGFERDDATIRSQVVPIAGHPAILAYYLGDEPRVTECPQAPALFKQRSDLVHSLDARAQTFTVIQAYEDGVAHDYAPWAGAVDIVGFDVYPCVNSSATCDFTAIDSAIKDIDRAGIARYWAVLGDFQDCYYRLPSPDELRAQFDHWAPSGMSGYLVFSWNFRPVDPTCGQTTLDLHPDNLAVLRYENARTFVETNTAPATKHPGDTTLLAGWLLVLTASAAASIAGVIALAARRRLR